MATKLPPIGAADPARPSTPTGRVAETAAEDNGPSELAIGRINEDNGPSELPIGRTNEVKVDKTVKRSARLASKRLASKGPALTIEDRIVDDEAKDEDDVHLFQRCKNPALEGLGVDEPDKVISIWGEATAEKDVFQPYFSQRAMNFDSSESSIGWFQHNIGIMCQRGFKHNQPNQDNFAILGCPEWLLFGVFDGHGPLGHTVSHFVQEHLPKEILERVYAKKKEWPETMKEAFGAVTAQLRTELKDVAYTSGTTTSVALLSRQEAGVGPMLLRCGHVGDSSVVYAKRPSRSKAPWEVTLLTDPHKPDRGDEALRINNAGGKVRTADEPGGVSRLLCEQFDLAMSRSMGDFHATASGLVSEPEISPEKVLEDGDDHVILACSDGIWDVIEPLQAVQIAAKFKPEEAQKAAEKLVQKAQVRWQEMTGDSVDDITVIVVRPSFNPLVNPLAEDSEEEMPYGSSSATAASGNPDENSALASSHARRRISTRQVSEP